MNAEQVERLRERAIGELRMADDAADEETAGVINHLAAGEGRLAYVLTLLPRNGKVTRVLIDASNGNVISGG